MSAPVRRALRAGVGGWAALPVGAGEQLEPDVAEVAFGAQPLLDRGALVPLGG